jgi:hypothetical protein
MKSLSAVLVALFLIFGFADPTLASETEEVFGRLGAVELLGDGPNRLNFGLGVFDMLDDDDSVAGAIEARLGNKLGFVGPLAGIVANADGGILGYAALYVDAAVANLLISLQTGVGAYEQGNSNDLGGTLEFHSALTLAYRFENRSQLGLRLGHISNLNLHDKNPGTDLLLLHYGIPL